MELMDSYQDDQEVQDIIAEVVATPYNISFYRYLDGLLKFKGKLVVGNKGDLRAQILSYMHYSNVGGYSGINATYQRLTSILWWTGVRQ